MQYRIPREVASIANGRPVKQIHRRFRQKFKVVLLWDKTIFPKGKKQSFDILKHCLAIGIPIIVNDQSNPAQNQDTPNKAPPKRNQIALPNKDKC